jgi:hypothetical protein
MSFNIDDYTDIELAEAFDISNYDNEDQIKLKIKSHLERMPNLADFFDKVEERLIKRPENNNIPTNKSIITEAVQDGVLNPVVRNTIDQIIIIDTQYIKNEYNPNNFTCNLSNPIRGALSMRLFSSQLPNSVNFLIQSYNCSLWFNKNNSNSVKISIPVGNYTDGSVLIDAINVAIGVVLFSFNVLTQKVSIVTNSINIIIPALGSTANSINWASNNLISSLGYILGFREKNTLLLDTSIQANSTIDLAPFKYLTICINDFNSSSVTNSFSVVNNTIFPSNTNTQCNIVNQNIPISSPTFNDCFAILTYQNTNNSIIQYTSNSLQRFKRNYFGPVNISRLSISIYNDKGILLDFDNRDWSFTILCEVLYQY